MKYSLPEYSPFNNPNEHESNISFKGSMKAASRKGIPNYTTALPSNSTGYYYKPLSNPYYSDMADNKTQPYPDFTNLQTKPRTTTPIVADSTVPSTQIPSIPETLTPGTPTIPGTVTPGSPAPAIPLTPGTQVPSTPSTPRTAPTPSPLTPNMPRPTTPTTPSIPRITTPAMPSTPRPAAPGTTTPRTTVPGAAPMTPGMPGMTTPSMPSTPGTTTPRTTMPGTVPMTPGMPGMTTPSMPSTPGTTTPRTTMPGAAPMTPGMPGRTTPSMPSNPGTTTPRTTMPGAAPMTPGMPGMTTPSMPSNPGTTTPRTTMPGTVPMTPGMPGMTTPSMPSTPGTTTPRTTMPGIPIIPGATNPNMNLQSRATATAPARYQESSFESDYDDPSFSGFANNGSYVTDANSYRVPMGVPMMPLYGYDNCEDADKDWDYMKQLYPVVAKKIIVEVEDECDKLEYDGSCMFDEYPDRVYLGRIIDRIYLKYSYMEDGSVNSESIPAVKSKDATVSKSVKSNQYDLDWDYRRDRYDHRDRKPKWLRDLIEVLLFNEILNRRRRYRGRKRWF